MNIRIFLQQKGASSVFLALLIMSILMVIGLGITALSLQQIKQSGQTGQSVVAIYAAEAGAERCLYTIRQTASTVCPWTNVPLVLDPTARYTVNYINGTDIIYATGQYGITSRKIELSW